MRWNWEKPHKNEHQSFQIYLFPPFLCSDNVGGWHIKSCSKANIPSTYQWAWNKYFESKHILWNSNWPSLLMGSNDVKLSMQSDLVFQLPGSDDSISMEKQENAKMKIHFFPPVSMQPEWNNICWYIQEAHAILRPKSSGIFNFNLWIYTVFVQWGAPLMRCVVAGRGSRCTKTALRPGCTSLWVLTLTPCFSLLSACISCCQAIWPREEVGGARSLDALRWSQGFFLFRRYCGTDCKCTFVRGDDILGRWIICSKRCWMLEELLWARASRSTAGSRAD